MRLCHCTDHTAFGRLPLVVVGCVGNRLTCPVVEFPGCFLSTDLISIRGRTGTVEWAGLTTIIHCNRREEHGREEMKAEEDNINL